MTMESDLVSLITPFCARVFPEFAPVATARPYVTYQQIGGDVVNFVDNTVPSSENAEIQINVWSDTRAQAKDIMKQIEAAMITAAAFQARPVSAALSDYDHDTQVYSRIQDFSIWSNR